MRKVLLVLLVLTVLLMADVSTALAGKWETQIYYSTFTNGCFVYNVERITSTKANNPTKANARFFWHEVVNIQIEDTCTGQTYAFTNEQDEIIQNRNWSELYEKRSGVWYDFDEATSVITEYRFKSYENFLTGEKRETIWINGVKQKN